MTNLGENHFDVKKHYKHSKTVRIPICSFFRKGTCRNCTCMWLSISLSWDNWNGCFQLRSFKSKISCFEFPEIQIVYFFYDRKVAKKTLDFSSGIEFYFSEIPFSWASLILRIVHIISSKTILNFQVQFIV